MASTPTPTPSPIYDPNQINEIANAIVALLRPEFQRLREELRQDFRQRREEMRVGRSETMIVMGYVVAFPRGLLELKFKMIN
ncbi:hypothetical protein VNI00_003847 [Paramarasmius palmivorus]|uniref:Uncharacterized protein n=1 Tax=Paramarasmius palmivorus TaxID=297713 RepID=A0AAW0DN82_9AGAR